jgi:hypothetical protein
MWSLERLENLNDQSILKSEVLHEEDFININQKKKMSTGCYTHSWGELGLQHNAQGVQ